MIFWFAFGALQIIIFVLLLHWGAKGDRRFLYLAAFLIPLPTLGLDVGILISWYKLILPVSVLALIIGRRELRLDTPSMRFLVAFIVYAIVLTIIWAFWDYNVRAWYWVGEALGWGSAQSTYRYWVQLGSTVSIWGIAFIPAWYVQNDRDLKAVINGYVNGNLVSVLFGFYQLVAVRVGLPFLNTIFIGRHRELYRDYGAYHEFGLDILRLSGLGGEPKHAGSFAVSALILLLAVGLFANGWHSVRFLKAKLLVFIAAIILTFSTGAWIASLIVFASFILIAILRGRQTALGYILIVTFCLALLMTLLGSETISEFFEYRVLDRFEIGLRRFEPKDAAFYDYLRQNPESILLGTGAGGLDFRIVPYIPPSLLERGGPFTPTYFVSRLSGEFGLIGIILVIGLWVTWFRSIPKNSYLGWGRVFLMIASIGIATSAMVSLSGYLLIASALVVAASRVRVASTPTRDYGAVVKGPAYFMDW